MANTFGSVPSSEKILYYAQMFQHDLGTLISIPSPNTFVVITGMTDVLGTGAFTFDGSKRLTSTHAFPAEYLVSFSASISSSAGNTNASFAIAKNGVIQLHTVSRIRIISPADLAALASSGIMSLVPGDFLELMAENPINSNDFVISHASVLVAMLGRT